MDNFKDDEESFEALLNSEDSKPPVAFIAPGSSVKGRVVMVAEDAIFIDYGGKSEGWADPAEFRDPEGRITLAVGEDFTLIASSPELQTDVDALKKRLNLKRWLKDQLLQLLTKGEAAAFKVYGGPDLTLPKLLWFSNSRFGCAMRRSVEVDGKIIDLL